jgi:hypothetical protein
MQALSGSRDISLSEQSLQRHEQIEIDVTQIVHGYGGYWHYSFQL